MGSTDHEKYDGSAASQRAMLRPKLLVRLARSLGLNTTFGGAIRILVFTAAIALFVRQRTGNYEPLDRPCNPFAEPGSLFVNFEKSEETIWRPFDKRCRSSHLSVAAKSILDSNNIEPTKVLPWLHNKTLVLIGDSIERFSLDYFCDFMEGEISIIDREHPFSPEPFRNGRDEFKENEDTMRDWAADGRPHRCHVDHKGLNFNVISFFMYGLPIYAEFEQQGNFFSRPHYFAPAEFALRVDHMVLGTLERAGLQADVVEFSSLMWDIMHWSEVDAYAAGSEDVVHAPFPTSARLDWYRQRLTWALEKIESAFPKAYWVWRRGHDVACGQYHVPCARTAQYIGVSDNIISQRKNWAVDEYGSMLRGHLEFFKDKVHPGELFRTVWIDSAFYNLREAYYRKEGNSARRFPRSSVAAKGLK